VETLTAVAAAAVDLDVDLTAAVLAVALVSMVRMVPAALVLLEHI